VSFGAPDTHPSRAAHNNNAKTHFMLSPRTSYWASGTPERGSAAASETLTPEHATCRRSQVQCLVRQLTLLNVFNCLFLPRDL